MFSSGGKAIPLVIKGMNNTTEDVVNGNLEATFMRGYKPFQPEGNYQGPVSIVGAGPSLSWTYKDIVGDVIACNSAHDFLISKGIIPKYAMIWDSHPIMGGVIDKPHKDVKYLIASRCHPSVFEKFKDSDVTVWHALGSEEVEKFLVKYNRMEPMIAGGSAAVTRSMYLAACLGYFKEQHLFGVDSCHSEGKTHVAGSISKTDEMPIRVCGKWFKIAPWMALQAGDFKIIGPGMKSQGIRIVVHGTGLIPYTATFMGIETPDIKLSFYEKHIRRPIHSVLALWALIQSSDHQLLGGANAGI